MTATATEPMTTERPTTTTAPAPSRPKPSPRNSTSHVVVQRLTLSVTTTVPATRLVVVTAGAEADRKTTWCDVLPVVALETRVINEYSKRLPIGKVDETAPDHAGMVKLGWSYEWQVVERDILIIDDEMGLMTAGELYENVENMTYRIVPCLWPESEDQERLLAVCEKLRREALEKVVGRRPRPIAPAGRAE
jgi:hypothetical protein